MVGEIESCRICGGESFSEVLDLGEIPLVDNFKQENGDVEQYPLRTVICDKCSLVQLDYVVPPEKMFHSDYAYDMSITGAGVAHFKEMADDIDSRYPEKSSVLDIGSNTGVLLEGFSDNNWEILGVEPSGNVCKKALEKGIPTLNLFFSEQNSQEILEKSGKFDVVTATNVLAHIDDLHGTVRVLKNILKDDGVFVFEAPYLADLIQKNEFDTIYHEHLSYFSVKPLVALFEQHGLEIIDIEKKKIHGGSLRVFVARKNVYPVEDSTRNFLEFESRNNIHSQKELEKFRENAEKVREDLNELLETLKDKGKSIAAIGAPAKGVTLLNYCNIDQETISFVSEKSDLKIGKYVPGTSIKVVSDRHLIQENPDYALLLPWNFKKDIMRNLEDYRLNGGKFIIPVPEPKVVD